MQTTHFHRELDAIHREFAFRGEIIRGDAKRLAALEERLRNLERDILIAESQIEKTEDDVTTHDGRIGYLEMAVQGTIYAIGAIAMSKSGDAVEIILKLIHK